MSIITVPIITYPSVRTSYPNNTGSGATLDAAEELVAMVIRVPKTGTLNKIGWRTGSVTPGTSYTLKVSVETVSDTVGQPVVTTNSGKTLYASGAESADITSGLASDTVYYTAINGMSGISVATGDLIAVTFRLTAVSGASISVISPRYGTYYNSFNPGYNQDCYTAVYLGGAWSQWALMPLISLEYSDGFCPSPFIIPPSVQSNIAWNSESDPDRRGIKFRIPFKCRLWGCMILADADSDIDVILYDSNEYSVKSGFPITIPNGKRRAETHGDFTLIFPTKPEISADTWYRLVLLPKSTTNITAFYTTLYDDGSYSGLDLSLEGDDLIYTYRNGAPSSGDHAWTDSNVKPYISLLIDGIDVSSGSGGGISRSRQLMG